MFHGHWYSGVGILVKGPSSVPCIFWGHQWGHHLLKIQGTQGTHILPDISYLHSQPHPWRFHWKYTYMISTKAHNSWSSPCMTCTINFSWKKRILVKHKCYIFTSKEREREEEEKILTTSSSIILSLWNLKRKTSSSCITAASNQRKKKPKKPGKTKLKITTYQMVTTWNISNRVFTNILHN